MIAIFDNRQDALDYSEDIHQFLLENRPGYNADRWSFENKSDKEDKWMVKIPKDAKKWAKKLKENNKIKEKMSKLPDDWKDN